MGRDLYIGDWHYDHRNILRYDNRPFFTTAEMNEALVKRWNAHVNPGDTVYVLGDMFWCNTSVAIDVLDGLAGEKVLIKGNHDNCKDSRFRSRFLGIHDYLEHKDDGRNVVLCHYPMPCFKNHFHGWHHLYAHVHTSFEYNMIEHFRQEMVELYTKPCNMYNVGAMMPWMEYTPRTLDEIIEGVKWS